MPKQKQEGQLDETRELPPGVKLIRTLVGDKDSVRSVSFAPAGRMLASGSYDHTMKLWDSSSGKLLHTLEGHTKRVDIVAFSADCRILASKSMDETLRLWSCETWDTVGVIPEPSRPDLWIPGLAFHPTLPLLATVGSEPDTPEDELCRLIHFWELDLEVLLGKTPEAKHAMQAAHHTTAMFQLTQTEHRKADEQQWLAAQRTRFEQAVFQMLSYVNDQQIARPECFISYSWGDREQERWVERTLAADLQKAGISVVLDRWENSRVGASVSRFIERIEQCDLIIVVGTPLYRKKYDNKDRATGYVVAAEVDLISNRLLATEAKKETVLPLLLAGERETSLPPLLHSRVYADFRTERAYFITAFDLILNIYQIPHHDPAVADLRESLRERDLR